MSARWIQPACAAPAATIRAPTCTTRSGWARCCAHLATVHNLHFYLDLMAQARQAIAEGRFAAFHAAFLKDRQRGLDD